MSEQSRRKFLQHGTLGLAAAGAAAFTPGLLAGAASAEPIAAGPLPEQPLVAYVKDHKTGEISVLVGEHEVLYRDPELAARLARIATHASRA